MTETARVIKELASRFANYASGDEGMWDELVKNNCQEQLDIWLKAAKESLDNIEGLVVLDKKLTK